MKSIKLLLTFLFTIIIIFGETNAQSAAEDPKFMMTVKNIHTTDPVSNIRDSILRFEVWCQQINQGESGVNDFEYCAGQFTWSFNRECLAGNLVLGIVANQSELPPGLRPPSFQVDSANNYLKMSGNLPNSLANFFISGIFPGTKLFTAQVRTSLPRFGNAPLYLKFKLGAAPNTFLAYFKPYPDSVDSEQFPSQYAVALMDTLNGTSRVYTVEDSLFAKPVEMESFISSVDKNTVTLNWTTLSEINNQGFDIERALVNSDEWTKAGNVSGNGTTNETKNYTFSERLSTGNYSYRLKQIDFNGGIAYHSLNNEVAVGIPSAYALSQNYPNPFNPTTKIDFELPADGNVNIILYDVSGREISKLVNEVKTAGYYTVQFSASNLASGMYFYRISSGNFVATKKMVVLK